MNNNGNSFRTKKGTRLKCTSLFCLPPRLIFSAAHDSIAICKDVVVHDGDQARIVQLLQYFKQALPFPGRQLARKIIDFLR